MRTSARISSPALLASSRSAKAEAPELVMGMVHLFGGGTLTREAGLPTTYKDWRLTRGLLAPTMPGQDYQLLHRSRGRISIRAFFWQYDHVNGWKAEEKNWY